MVPNRRSSNVGDDAVRWWRSAHRVLSVVFDDLAGAELSTRPRPRARGLLDDAAWLIFVMVFPSYIMQMLCMAVQRSETREHVRRDRDGLAT
jgi:hypothetical protein